MTDKTFENGAFRIHCEIDDEEWEELAAACADGGPESISEQTDLLFYDSLDCDISITLNESIIHGLPSSETRNVSRRGTTPVLYFAYLFDGFVSNPRYPTTLETFDSAFELHLEAVEGHQVRIVDPSHGISMVAEKDLVLGLTRFLSEVASEVARRAPEVLEWDRSAFLVKWISGE